MRTISRTKRTKASMLVALPLMLAVLSGCGGNGGGEASASGDGGGGGGDDPLKLGFLVYDIGVDPWMNVAVDTIETEGEAAGFDVTASNGRNDVGEMSSIMDQYINQEMDAILIAAPDPDSLVPSVVKADAAGIPVFTFSLNLSDEAPITSFIGADDVNIGRVQGELLVEALGGEGTVALMTGVLGSGPQIGRTQGIHEVLDEHPEITVLEEQANNWQNDKTISLTQDWMSKYGKGELNAIVAQGPELAAGARLAHSSGREEIMFIACDYPEDARAAIQEGALFATLNQSPALMAEEAIEAISTVVIDGGEVEEEILIETPTVTSENVEDMPAAY